MTRYILCTGSELLQRVRAAENMITGTHGEQPDHPNESCWPKDFTMSGPGSYAATCSRTYLCSFFLACMELKGKICSTIFQITMKTHIFKYMGKLKRGKKNLNVFYHMEVLTPKSCLHLKHK